VNSYSSELDRIVQQFFPFSIDKPTKSKLSSQYKERNKEIYGEDFIENFDYKEGKDFYFDTLLKRFVGADSYFSDLENKVSISSLNSKSDYTCTFSYGAHQIVLLDTNTIFFIWMSNKILLYGHSFSSKEQYNHYLSIFKYFMLRRRFGNSALVESIKPKMPAHPNVEAMRLLVHFQQIQESFLLAHELAHIKVSQHDIASVASMIESDKTIQILSKEYLITENDVYKFCSEVAADKIALLATLKEFKKEYDIDSDIGNKMFFEFVTTAVLVLFRYELWLELAMNTWTNNDNETGFWVLRSQTIRALIRQNNIWNDTEYVVNILEDMEKAFEPAALEVPSLLDYILSQPGVEKAFHIPLQS